MPDDSPWLIRNTQLDAEILRQHEAVFAISNGYLGLSGRLAELRDNNWPTTLINGAFDDLDLFAQIRPSADPRPDLDPRYFETAGRTPAIANLPDPLWTQVFLDERELSLTRGGLRDFEQSLDLATGVYRYRYEFRDQWGRTTRVDMERFATLAHAHRAYQRYSLTPLDHAAQFRIHAGIDGRTRSNATGERMYALHNLWTDPPHRCRLFVRTPARGLDVQLGVSHRTSGPPPVETAGVAEHDRIYTRYLFAPQRGQTITLERCVVLTSSEDLRHNVVAKLDDELDAAHAEGFAAALAAQRTAWDALWRTSDVQIAGDDDAQRRLRFALYHLLAAAPRFSDRLSVPAALLTGERRHGHTRYHAETHVLPFYTFTQPAYAATCLNWRYHGLRPARETALNLGCAGAKFAWHAAPAGEECLGRWHCFPHTNIHVNAGVACALMQYVRATGDERFLFERGLELLIETARFYAARVEPDAANDTCHLDDVGGPDEAHTHTTDNFYTNYTAAANLRAAAAALDRCQRVDPQHHALLVRRVGLHPDEPARWRQLADRLPLLFDPQTQVYEQFRGFHDLKPLPPHLRQPPPGLPFAPLHPFQALQQPDVVAALMLFRDQFPPDVLKANSDFYQPRTLDLAAASHALNALAAASLGDLESAYRSFRRTTGLDLDAPRQHLAHTPEPPPGLHAGALGGAWLATIFGFGGVSLTAATVSNTGPTDVGLTINPRLPESWTALKFTLLLHSIPIAVSIDRQQIKLEVPPAGRLHLPALIAGHPVTLEPGRSYTFAYDRAPQPMHIEKPIA